MREGMRRRGLRAMGVGGDSRGIRAFRRISRVDEGGCEEVYMAGLGGEVV